MEFTISVETVRTIELVAALVTLIGFLVTVLVWMLRQSEDPFLRGYVIAAFVFAISVWLGLRFAIGRDQLCIVLSVYGFSAVVGGFMVVWRAMEAKRYRKNERQPVPSGFSHVPNKVPYWCLLGALSITIFCMIFIYTSIPENDGNTGILMLSLLGLAVIQMALRLAWQHFSDQIEVTFVERGEKLPTDTGSGREEGFLENRKPF